MLEFSDVKIRATVTVVKLRATAAVVRPNSGAAIVKILAEKAAVVLTAAVNAPGIALGVQAELIKASALTGWFLKYVEAKDTLGLSDVAALRLSRLFAELTSIADTATITAGKRFNDGFGVSETQVATVVKGLADAAGLSDVVVRNIGKGVIENPLVTDAYALRLGRGLADSVQNQEGPASNDYALTYFAEDYTYDGKPAVSLNKGISDVAGNFTDYINYINTNKGLTETPLLTDALTRFIQRSLTDTFTATDDFLGIVNPDDDEVMTFSKGLTELATFGDTFARLVYFVRTPSDSAAFADSTVSRTGKALADLPTLTDTKLFTMSKPLADAAGVTDAVASSYRAAKTDSAGFTDGGTLRMQGYCDFSYFEADYVGTYQTF